MKFSFLWAAIALSAMSTCAVAQTAAGGDAQAGQASSAICSACHGADGNSTVPQWPSLAGQRSCQA
jgi:cytochrome c553